jgi:DNA-binding NarL/FixJ family response regulator
MAVADVVPEYWGYTPTRTSEHRQGAQVGRVTMSGAAASGCDSAGASLNLVVIEDHLAVRKGLELLLRGMGHHVIGTSDNALAGCDLIRRRQPDVAIIDVDLPGESGTRLCRRILEAMPAMPVLIYTGVTDIGKLRQGLDCGARGFCLKTGAPEELSTALRTIAAGGTYLDAGLRPLLASSEQAGLLSQRERQILGLLADGKTGQQAAGQLHLSPHTVRSHVRSAMLRLGASTRTHAIVLAMLRGEISPGPKAEASPGPTGAPISGSVPYAAPALRRPRGR